MEHTKTSSQIGQLSHDTFTMVLDLPTVSVDGETSTGLCDGAAKVVTALRPEWEEQDLCYKVGAYGGSVKIHAVRQNGY